MNTPVILLVVLVTTLVQIQCNETCTEWYTITPVPTPHDIVMVFKEFPVEHAWLTEYDENIYLHHSPYNGGTPVCVLYIRIHT